MNRITKQLGRRFAASPALLASVAGAAVLLSSAAPAIAQQWAEPKVDVAFNRYYDTEQAYEVMREIAEAYPDLGDARNWRIQSRASWEVVVDPEVNLTLKVGIENEYDTSPNGVERSDTDYFILLSWTY